MKEVHLMAIKNLIENESKDYIQEMLKFELGYCECLYNKIELDLISLKNFEGDYGIDVSIDGVAHYWAYGLLCRHCHIRADDEKSGENEA